MTRPKPSSQFESEPSDDGHDIELASETFRGDVRDSILAWIKTQPKAWPFMSEGEQRDMANAIDAYSFELVRQMARHLEKAITVRSRNSAVAKLVEYKEKDGIEAKLKLAGTEENIVELHKAVGQEVLVITSGVADFLGAVGDPEIDPDQPNFPNLGNDDFPDMDA